MYVFLCNDSCHVLLKFYVLENPVQILCQHYWFLMENLQPTIVSEIMKEEKLISSADLYIISKAPIGHMRNSHIF